MNRMPAAGWLGLLAAPIVVLSVQSIDYALVHVACTHGSRLALGIVSGIGLLFSGATAWLAWRLWRSASRRSAQSGTASHARVAFFAVMAMLVGALCTLIQLMMWFPQWLLSPCR
ncbi:hypothetical protein [Paraburkholderia diazotrophica]|uniref:Uncharacterized protein n=1 Tax=Paraburkholderia diazotrophica TaxID=667676 RepID=A0A1H6WJ25_9BURK|nr:hypothetical protein [Paraburkholderia diazotrophica]SEJ17059.1 hypothetical protein SAMN05192539_1007145 [Paraburkholderia diazotrophica]